MTDFFFLFISLVIILISCTLFSNAIEWIGVKFNLSHGVTGSILAAVGTALPETMVPIVAIFWGASHGESLSSEHIAMGAIIGAPFMLSTLAFFLVGLSSLTYFKSNKRKDISIKVDRTVLRRDLKFFILAFSFAFVAAFLSYSLKIVLAIGLVVMYFIYIYKTFKEEQDGFEGDDLEHNLEPLLFSKLFLNTRPTINLIGFQLLSSLVLLVFSAHHFVESIKHVSEALNFEPFIVSLLLAPIATELPEKFNSWVWIKNNKDTLAVGNISGALVFQSAFPVSIGLMFTSWSINTNLSYFIFFSCIACCIYMLSELNKEKLTYKPFLLCGSFYLVYLILVVSMNI